MPTAFLTIRHEPQYRRDAFEAGLSACGFRIDGRPRGAPAKADVLVIWNRYGANNAIASTFERAGCPVIVAENGWMGREWQGELWYSLVLDAPAGAGRWPTVPGRWEAIASGDPVQPWGLGGRELVVLAQRGIGPPGVAQPSGWHEAIAAKLRAHHYAVRIREHPGERPAKPLLDDLERAAGVVTWASCAALKALHWGFHAFYGFDRWIGAPAATPVARLLEGPRGQLLFPCPDRTATFQRVGSAIWRIHEIASGQPFRLLLSDASRCTASAGTTAAR